MALITFDLDGTLQQNPFRTAVFPHVARALTPAYCERHPETAAAEAARLVTGLVRQEFRRRQEAKAWEAAYDWDDIIARIGEDLGYRGERLHLPSLVRHYCTPEHIAALPGARDCLMALRAAGHTLRVATNGFAAYQEPVLEALGLLEFFDLIITPDRTGSAKPVPEFLLAAGGPPALHVGDSLIHDVYGARLAGFASLWFWPKLPAGFNPAAPDAAGLAAALADRFAEETAWVPTGNLTLAECRPDFSARELAQVPAIVAAWAAALPPGRRSRPA